jgi:hypothetical protein
MVSDTAHFHIEGLSKTQLRRRQREHTARSYKQATSQLSALVLPLPSGTLHAASLESFRHELFTGKGRTSPCGVDNATVKPSGTNACITPTGSACPWFGIWAPVASYYDRQRHVETQEAFHGPTFADKSVDGSLFELCGDQGDGIFSIGDMGQDVANIIDVSGTYSNYHPEAYDGHDVTIEEDLVNVPVLPLSSSDGPDVLQHEKAFLCNKASILSRLSARSIVIAEQINQIRALHEASGGPSARYSLREAHTATDEPDSGAVNGTFFCYRDLGAAVSASWECCLAAQPLLAKAVTANGGQAVFSQPLVKAESSTPFVPYELPPLFQTNIAPSVSVPAETKQHDCRQQ